MTPNKPCSRCGKRPSSTPRNSYCKPCRAEYQRAWRARRLLCDAPQQEHARPAPRQRLRGTPTHEEMLRYRLL